MPNLPPYPDADDETRLEPAGATGGAPRWQYAVGIIIAIAIVALFVGLHLSGAVGSGGH